MLFLATENNGTFSKGGEMKYRMLKKGEIIRKGDEILYDHAIIEGSRQVFLRPIAKPRRPRLDALVDEVCKAYLAIPQIAGVQGLAGYYPRLENSLRKLAAARKGRA